MKLLIIGASGLVGWNLWQVARAAGHEVRATYATHPLPGLVSLRLDDSQQLRSTIEALWPDAVVCCAAWSWVDGCESDPGRAFRENRDLPANAARAATQAGARFVHFSTSYVFDGKRGPYSESDEPDPISVYAESKLAGEEEVAGITNGTAMIVRTMGVYGSEPQQKNFVYQVRRNLAAGKRMKVPNDQIGNATEAANLAEGVLALLEIEASGIWNLAGDGPNLLRADFARQIARTYGLDQSLFD
ncbi:MAG: SDR family oxidoreductase, partial [Verrucomicrobiota bacterium]|nr:SDR family oxidoreductase [Verrucomicrobiota bacterium]